MTSPYEQQPYQHYPPQPPMTPPPPSKKPRKWPWVAGAAAVVALAVIIGFSLGATNSMAPTATATGTPTTAPAPAQTAALAPAQLTVPDVQGMTSEQAAAALAAAGFTDITFEQNGAAPTAKVMLQNPVPGYQQPGTKNVHLVAEPPPPAPHRAISSRDWLLIAKAPDSHVGERIVVYGKVTQFDAATGTSGFRANVDGVKHVNAYDYDTNTILRGSVSQLADVVQDDLFRAEVTVGGSYSYTTTLGGSLTAPVLNIDSITVIN